MRNNNALSYFIPTALVALAVLGLVGHSYAKKKSSFADPELKYRQYMVEISRQLGVTCIYCHDVNKFKSNKKKPFRVAKEHIRITALLNQQGFKGQPKADCYLCHRGKAIPDYVEKIEKN